MTWAIGFVERPDTEYQIIRYKDFESAAESLCELMAMKGPYTTTELLRCMRYVYGLEIAGPESFDEEGSQVYSCELDNIIFVICKYEKMTPEGEMTFRVIQDHRDCTSDFCFGDIAQRN